MEKLIIEDWVLYEMQTVGFMSTDAATGQDFADCKQQAKSIRVVGTKKQIEALSKSGRFKVDEAYDYKREKKGSWWEGIIFSDDPKSSLPTLKKYNATFDKVYKRYEKMYMQNDNEILIFST